MYLPAEGKFLIKCYNTNELCVKKQIWTWPWIILIAYISALTFSNQAFAQATNQGIIHSVSFVTNVPETLQATASHLHEIGSQVEKVLAGEEAQAGNILEGQQGRCMGPDGQCTEPIPTIR